MASVPIVSVSGEAEISAAPELAVVWLAVTAQERTQEATATQLAAQRAQLAALLEQYADAISSADAHAVQIYPQFGKKSETVTGYVGRCGYTVEVHDFSVLSDLLVGATAVERSEVSGPSWRLRRDSDVYREARLAAVADAVRRAEDYAGAFGAQLTSLVEVADQGMSGSVAAAPAMQMRMMAAAPGGEADSGPSFDLEPVTQRVSGTIEARFGMSDPDLARPLGEP